LGSTYADWLSPLVQLFGHAQADDLRFVRHNDLLKDLNKEFINLKEAGKLKIKGQELVEDKFVGFKKLWRRQVVEDFAGATFFGEPYKVPASDHFSIAKPADKDAIQHRLLCQFILENALSPGPEARNARTSECEPPAPTPAGQKSPASTALVLWQEKLSFLLAEEAKTVDPDQKFRLQKSIEEAKAKIREHGGQT
jgi:hypothetical protein